MTNTQIDELAARAMQGILSGPKEHGIFHQPVDVAKLAYAVADAMAEEKKRREQTKMPVATAD